MARFEVNFYSYTLGHGVDIVVTLPSFSSCDRDPGVKWTHAPKAKYPVLYLLHGHGNDYQCWTRYTAVERLAEEQRIALVTFNSGNKAYNNLPDGDNYYDFLHDELPDFVTNTFPISDRREDTYIAGLSMGGYGTLAHAFTAPDRYCAFGAMSPGVTARPKGASRYTDREGPFSELYRNTIEPIDELEKRVREGADLPKGYICCGRQDFLFERVCHFKRDVDALGVDFTWHFVDGYEHEWRYWDLEIANFLAWIPRTDYYADKPHKV